VTEHVTTEPKKRGPDNSATRIPKEKLAARKVESPRE
jgi:hypothetical protein